MEKLSLKKFEKKQLVNSQGVVGGTDSMVHKVPESEPTAVTTTSSDGYCMTTKICTYKDSKA